MVAYRRHILLENINFQSTYNPQKSSSVLIQQGRLLTATEEDSFIGDILISNNVIVEVGKSINPPLGTKVIDARGKWVTP